MSALFFPRRDFLAVFAIAISLSFVFLAVTNGQDPAKNQKCQVCHNTRNPHTITIACNAVAKHLQNHPGDYEGPCQGVSNEKPPKPPKPTPDPD
jgi:hypothetical protein